MPSSRSLISSFDKRSEHLSMLMATPLFAQAAIQEPGAFAFYHPNADVLNGGRPTPAASGALASVPLGASDAYAPWAATRTARLALSAIVPTTRLQVLPRLWWSPASVRVTRLERMKGRLIEPPLRKSAIYNRGLPY